MADVMTGEPISACQHSRMSWPCPHPAKKLPVIEPWAFLHVSPVKTTGAI